MTDKTPTWKQAAKDADHPLHEATWTLFREQMHVERAAARLEPDKEIVIPYLLEIVRNKDLQYPDAPGEGYAPINAIRLLGYWQVVEAVPDLIAIIEDPEHSEATTRMWDRSIVALKHIGEPAFEPLLAAVERNPDMQSTLVSLVADLRVHEDRTFALLTKTLDSMLSQDRFESGLLMETLLTYHKDRGIAHLEENLRKGKYKGSKRQSVKLYIEDAQNGKFESFKDYINPL